MSTKRQATRDAILDATWQRLERGRDARLEDVAADAGVTRQAVYLHFGSRAGLLLALVDHMDSRLGLYARIEENRAIGDPVARLDAVLSLMADYEPKIHRVAMVLFHAAQTDADVRAAFDDRMSRRRADLARVIKELRARGRLVKTWTSAEIIDLLWQAGAPPSYDLLVVQRGWKPARYKAWLLALARSFVRR